MRERVLRTLSPWLLVVLPFAASTLFAEGPMPQIKFGQVGLRVADREAHKKR